MIHENQTLTILKTQNTLNQGILAEAAQNAEKQRKPLSEYLIEQKLLTETDLYQTLSKHFRLPFVDLSQKHLQDAVLDLLPEAIAQTHQVAIFDQNENDVLLAMLDPDDLQAIDFVKKKTGKKVKPPNPPPSAMQHFLNQNHRGVEDSVAQLAERIEPKLQSNIEHLTTQTTKSKEKTEDTTKLREMSEELPVIRIVDTLLEYAVFSRASDVHIEPTPKDVIVRFRIDGLLGDVMTLPKTIQAGIVARIKVLSNLKLDEHRLPQDGRFKIESKNYKISLRVSIIPVYDGEKVVLRLLNETGQVISLEELGLLLGQRHIVEKNMEKPHGMILVTGPTGSGKTTTLYSIMHLLNQQTVNICTIEDPIEYRMPRINQSQVNPRIGFTFATGLRALLRQDPDIIMVGEIRDQETAEICAHAAMTGHLVLSTLHTNDAPGSLPRLQEMGVAPFLVASTTNCIIAQRLVRKLCACKEPYHIDKELLKKIEEQFHVPILLKILQKEQEAAVTSLEAVTFYKPKGCAECNNNGYKGRIGIFEVLEITETIAQLILEEATKIALTKAAQQEGMITMVEDGFIKAQRGTTSIEEILRVTKD